MHLFCWITCKMHNIIRELLISKLFCKIIVLEETLTQFGAFSFDWSQVEYAFPSMHKEVAIFVTSHECVRLPSMVSFFNFPSFCDTDFCQNLSNWQLSSSHWQHLLRLTVSFFVKHSSSLSLRPKVVIKESERQFSLKNRFL